MKKIIQNYEDVVNIYKQHCFHLKASLNECIYAFQAYINHTNIIK